MTRIYLDHAATTPVHPSVRDAMLPYLGDKFGNPSSIHDSGREAAEAVDYARQAVAALIGARPEEIIFTSGGSESDTAALFGIFLARQDKGRHIITTAIEHHAVVHTCQALEKRGARVTYLPVDQYGLVTPEQVAEAIRDDTIIISIMHANNEIGTIEPVAEIGRVCRERDIIFHTDAVQTVGHVPIDVAAMNADLLSLSAHKFYGPKGCGALYKRRGVRITPLIYGGGHERGLRSGTENVPGIAGLGAAARLALDEMDTEGPRQAALRDRLLDGIEQRIPDIIRTGHPTQRLPNSASVCVRYIEGESMLLNLDMAGIAASSGSACTSGSLEASHVLLAIGLEHDVAHGSLRLTLGHDNTDEDVDFVLDTLPPIVEKLRAMSPLYPGRAAS
ncbi:MAG: cysteine desulfurase NifS [Armatimonadota bacterium]|nr:MAG: cysteine desulfurase NifS [Armatimonadota bacterium]